MIKRLLLIAGLAAGVGIGYVAAPSAVAAGQYNPIAMDSAEEAPAPIEVKVCPMTHGKVHGEGAGSEVVGKYKVYFCCKGCPAAFAKLSAEQKLQKAEEAYAIQQKQQESNKDSHHHDAHH